MRYLQICPSPQLSGSGFVEYQANKSYNKQKMLSIVGKVSPRVVGEKCLYDCKSVNYHPGGQQLTATEKLLLVIGNLKRTKCL